ncbi:hypothetical protein [Flavobacterium pectinovorum]|uniref:Uncharacterized protein n=1 Tax=Flavobacterium pectinovorum TaxID=29533 RepID=A0A502F5V9_9FLAO|nr:hypothetical protein [Flavobacterium pectinovorum]TPG44350.1 hypothetical protein EAH81_02430 [Flavobacterium pectinovorum]
MEKIDCNKLYQDLSKFGNVEVMNAGIVFTVLITGTDLTHSVFNVIGIINNWQKGKFPMVEILRNTDNFILVILKS